MVRKEYCNIMQAEQVIFQNIYVCTYTYVHVTAIMEKGMNLEKSKEGYMGGGKEEMM